MYLISELISVAVFIYFIIACFYATRLLRQHYNLLYSTLFILGLISLILHSPIIRKNQEQEIRITGDFDDIKNDTSFVINQKDFYTINISIHKNKLLRDSSNNFQAHTNLQGLHIGHSWTKIAGRCVIKNNKLNYDLIGKLNWILLGTNITSELKTIKGSVNM